MSRAQERALRLLAAYAATYGPTPYSRPAGVHTRTLEALARQGLVQLNEMPMTTTARLTAAGRALAPTLGVDSPS